MVYLRFAADGLNRYGILEGKTVYEITPNFYGAFKKTGEKYPLAKVKLLAPCRPGKVISLGLNYREHVKEMKMATPINPVIFLKAPSAVIGTDEKIISPKISKHVDFEAELAIVIRKKTRNVPAKDALDYVLGYTCFNDVTARDIQRLDGQWARAKSFDTFAPMGPWIISGINGDNLKIESFLNGKKKQGSNTSNMVFSVPEIISFVSEVMTLNPGDVITCGTPPGVGPMKKGDKIKIKIEGIGELVNTVA
jgi:2-keto-4-pentenoate hydratase/2-oxohepta-3-ene-1,7-dioic acid hydratase in catechol pathway